MNLLHIPPLVMLLTFAWAQNSEPHFEYDYSYRVVTEQSGAISYIFEGDQAPPLELDSNGDYPSLNTVNLAFETVGLSPVSESVPERSSITGERWDRTQYVWEGFPTITLNRSICERTEAATGFWARFNAVNEDYDCVWKITVDDRP